MKSRLRLWGLSTIILVLSLLVSIVSTAQEVDAEDSCYALLNSSTLVIVDAQYIEGDAETVCRVSGITGQIHYVVKLPIPEQWNGRFLMAGDGGHDGSIGLANRVGFVVANSDSGHSSTTEPGATFAFNNRQAEIDYAYRANHTTVLAAKQLIQNYYGRPQDYSYFDGCSTGGRQAAVSAERYPDDFDGIIGGALFNNAVEVAMEQLWSSAVFFYDVDGDGVGFDNNITMEDINALRDAVLAEADVLGNDRIRDGIIDNPIAASEVFTEEDIDALGEELGWTEGQIQAIKDVYSGPHDSNGNSWYKGKPLGTEYAWGLYIVPTPDQFPNGNGMTPFQTGFGFTFVNYLWFENDPGVPTSNPGDPSLLPEDGEFRWLDFNFDTNTPTGATVNPNGEWDPNDGGGYMRELLNASDTDLTPFLVDNDSKYLLYHGWADPLIGAEPTVDYFEGIVEDTFGGDAEAAANNVRLFMVPGMGHCSDAGLGSASEWDRLAPMIDWVENGIAPDSIVATHTTSEGVVDNERIICPWPLQPTYIGSMEDDAQNLPENWIASNFECQEQQ